MGTKLTICTIASRYTANSTTLDSYICQTIRNLELITESNIIQSKISDWISILIFFLHDLKIHIMPLWGKSTEMGGGQIRAAIADLENCLSDVRDGV